MDKENQKQKTKDEARTKKSFPHSLASKTHLPQISNTYPKSMASSVSLSFSSSLHPHPLKTPTTHRAQDPNFNPTHCAYAPPSKTRSPSSSSSSSQTRKKHWKQGEFPGVSESSAPRRTPLKNIKKKLDRKEKAKAWVNTVTEEFSTSIEKKQWLRALQVYFSSFLILI